MNEQEQTTPQLTFPCDFPIKIIGVKHPEYIAKMTAILLSHVPDLNLDSISSRESNGGKYLSLSARFTAQSREQLDNLYRELSAHPDVKWVL